MFLRISKLMLLRKQPNKLMLLRNLRASKQTQYINDYELNTVIQDCFSIE